MTLDFLRLDDRRLLSGIGRCELLRGGRIVSERAAPRGRTLRILAHLPRALGTTALLCVLSTDGGEYERVPMRYRGIAEGFDVYEGAFRPSEAGLFFYSFLGESPMGRFYGMRSPETDGIAFSRTASGAHFQLTVTEFAFAPPAWLYGGIMYHIFVDRFRRTGFYRLREDAVFHTEWEDGCPLYPAYRGAHVENNDFFGGTLDGIAEKLDDLAKLGVNCLYLSPIFEAYSNHKYDTGNYEKIDDMLGGEAAFSRLIAAAHRHGMRIILDVAFNHTGSDSIYFNRKGRYPSLGAYQSKESPYYDWYTFCDHPDRYEAWWGIETLPRLSPDVPSLRAFFTGEEGIVARYAGAGIGGLRLDVVDELSDGFVRDIKARLAANAPDAVLFGEVWEDASHKVAYGVRKHYYTGRELDGVMNYPLREGLISYIRIGEIGPLRYALCEVLPNMPRRIAASTMNVLGTHDTVRILTALAGEGEEGRTMDELATLRLSPDAYRKGRDRLILAYLALATLPGVPSIFYGDEAGVEGYADPFNRRPYPWHRRDPQLLRQFRAIGQMRRHEPVFREGSFRLLYLDASVFAFSRDRGKRVVLTVLNRSARGLRIEFDAPVTALFGGKGKAASYLVSPEGGGVFRTVKGRRLSLCFDDGERIFFS